MQKIAFIWASLFACLAVIDVAGVWLSRYGDIIAEQSGLSRGWVGLTQLATVTSLPKLVTGLSSVAAVAAGIWLPFIAKDLAAAMAWEQRFVGTLFVARSSPPRPRSWSRSLRYASVRSIWPACQARCWPMYPSPTPPRPSPP